MSLSIYLIVLFALSAIEGAKQSEVCVCVPLNICAKVNRFSKEDARYFTTVLKCKDEGYVRCCPQEENANSAVKRRSDDAENIILIDDKENIEISPIIETTTEDFDHTTTDVGDDLATTTEDSEEFLSTEAQFLTTEQPKVDTHEPRVIDNNISVIYPKNLEVEQKKKEMMEHLFLIFPNGEIETALAESKAIESTSVKPIKRVVVRKRLVNKVAKAIEGAESEISETVLEPKPMDVEDVKKRLSDIHKSHRRNDPINATTSTNIEGPIEETTEKKQTRKKIRYRKRKASTTAIPLSPPFKALTERSEKVETSTAKSIHKIIYNTKGRTNFLKRPSSQQSYIEDEDEVTEQEVTEVTTSMTSTEKPEEFSLINESVQSFFTTPTPPKVLKYANLVDLEHRAMIETVHKTLSAIHSGVDMKLVERMIESHKSRMKKMRKKKPTNINATSPTRPYRGIARSRKPVTPSTKVAGEIRETGTRTRNLSRTRNATVTTDAPKTKSPRTVNHASTKTETDLEEVDMLSKFKTPLDFKPSPLYGITMDKFNEFDREAIEKIHETLRPHSKIQNGFFPVIQNGTPSTLL